MSSKYIINDGHKYKNNLLENREMKVVLLRVPIRDLYGTVSPERDQLV